MTIDIGTERLRDLARIADLAAAEHKEISAQHQPLSDEASAHGGVARDMRDITTALRALIAARDWHARAKSDGTVSIKELAAILGSKP